MGDEPGRVRVLHVEDDRDFAELAAELLEREDADLDVELETSADGGLERLREDAFDCVVSDYDLPGMDGLAFLEAVREEAPELPFILFTGKGSEEVASEATSAGVTDYLQKAAGTDQFAILANRIRHTVEGYRARRASEASERQLRQVYDRVTDGFFAVDADWRYTYVNAAAARMVDLPAEELRGRTVWDAFPALVDSPFEDALRTAMETQETTSVEAYYPPHDAWYDVTVYPAPEGISIYFRDVTDRREREGDLELMDQLVREMNDGVVIAQAGVIEYVNPRVVELFGGDESALVGEPIFEFIAPEYRETVAERHRARLADEADDAPMVYDITIETAGGERVPVELSVSRIEYRGEPATLTLVRDVSSRREREAELRRLKEEYETVFETAQDGIFLVDVDRSGDGLAFRFKRLNPAHEAVSGLASDEIRGQRPADFLPADDAAEVVAHYRRCVEAREPIAYDEVLEMPAGTIHWRTKLGPVVTDGEVTQIVGVARDVTAQRERERELERQNERLEQFASVVSHDLRNPLSVAEGHLELALETGEREHLETVATAHDRMDALVDRLLTLAREGREVGDLEPVALPGVAEECWATAETDGASLEVRADRTVLADATRLKQLLENLFRNAVEYGGEATTVVVDDLEDGFFVADDGPGLPEDDPEAVFDPGYSTNEAGTGFGLSIVRDIAEAHGWEVAVTSSEAGGARFEFSGAERP